MRSARGLDEVWLPKQGSFNIKPRTENRIASECPVKSRLTRALLPIVGERYVTPETIQGGPEHLILVPLCLLSRYKPTKIGLNNIQILIINPYNLQQSVRGGRSAVARFPRLLRPMYGPQRWMPEVGRISLSWDQGTSCPTKHPAKTWGCSLTNPCK